MQRHERRVTRENAANMNVMDIQTVFGNRFGNLMDGFNPEGDFSDNND